ncbi:hypothetical protein U9M48_011624 [Paspalum notatum var. saurae]|uniref:MATH domain-containing protein n=1 Tax=Paspalum notatum var. saurae TaxID=547442 RepID=A0AAQ3SXV2_PASNO
MLKVEGYSRLKHTHKNGSYLESSAFKVAGKTWRLHCYLNGANKEDACFVSVGLDYCDAAATWSVVHAEYEFVLVPHHHGTDHPSHSKRSSAAFGKRQPAATWGFRQFISREALEGSMFLKDDCFAIQCKVTVFEERTAREEAVQAQDMERLGLLLCKCDDDMCKRHHARKTTLGLREALASQV